MAVNSTHPGYDAMVEPWQMMSDVCSSESVIHRLGERYLPRLSGQDDTKYQAYVKRASFVAFTKRAIEAFHGMVMRKDVHVDGHETINVDGKGSSVSDYVSEVLKHFLKYGRCGTLVDMPVVSGKLSVADEIEKNIFPRLLFYPCQDIINWKKRTINNIEVLSMVVLRESVDRSEDEYGHDIVYNYRVLDLVERDGKYIYRQRVFDHALSQVGDEVIPKRSNKPLGFIPFYIHGGVEVQYPPLLPIAEQNLHHYRLDADYKHGLHFVALPTPWVAGVDKENKPTTIGPTVLWAFEDHDTKCGMLEFTGAGLSQVASALSSIVEIIITLASRVIAPQKSSNDESALAASIRSDAETSSLASIVNGLSGDLTNAIRVASWWKNGEADKIVVTINQDFMPTTLSGTDVLAYITSWLKGGISYDSLFNLLKSGEVIKGDRAKDDELKDIDDEQKKRALLDIDKNEEKDPDINVDLDTKLK